MDLTAIISGVTTGIVAGGGTLFVAARFGARHVVKRLEQVGQNQRDIVELKGVVCNVDDSLKDLKDTSRRIEGSVAGLKTDVAYMKGRFNADQEHVAKPDGKSG